MISVIIPAYNRQDTIVRAVQSVLNQTYKEIEVIVVDDCSKDNTVAELEKVQDSRLRVIECEKNGGACAARNIGILNAKGEYIAFQDSDDEWYANKLELQMEQLISKDVDMVSCGFYKFDGSKKEKMPSDDIEGDYLERLLKGNYITTQSMLIKKECLQEEKFDERIPRFQDWELSMRLLSKYKFYFINQPLLNAYVQKDSITNNLGAGAEAAMYILEKHKSLYERYPGNELILKKIHAYGKMCSNNFEHNYYRDILKEYKFEVSVLVRCLQFELKKIIAKKRCSNK